MAEAHLTAQAIAARGQVATGVATAEVDEKFVPDGAGLGRDLIDWSMRSDQFDWRSEPKRPLRDIGDIDGHQIHRDAPDDRRRTIGNEHRAPRRQRSEEPVGVTNSECRQATRLGGRVGRAVPHRVARFHRPHLNDRRLERDNRLHRVRSTGCGISAVQAVSGSEEVVVILGPQKNAGRVGQRASGSYLPVCGRLGKPGGQSLEALPLPGVLGAGRLIS